MSEETKKILDMIQNGTITVEEGEILLDALRQKDEEVKTEVINRKKSTLRVKILANDSGDEKVTVNVNLPLVMAKKISGLMNIVPKSAKEELDEQGINLDSIDLKELIEMFEDGQIDEDLVNIDAGEDDEQVKVRIYVD